MSVIASVHARSILDSRGQPTVEVDVTLASGASGRGAAPSGASTGRHEACELRDGDPDRFDGKGVQRAVANVNEDIAQMLIGRDVREQRDLDGRMVSLDGTENLSRLGGNAIVATSMAIARAAAKAERAPLYRYIASLAKRGRPRLPMPMVNILSGGAHAGRSMDFQDFLVIPVGAESYTHAIAMAAKVRNAAAAVMQDEGLSTRLADEGGLSPGYAKSSEALDLMMRAFDRANLHAGTDVAIAIDVAATELYSHDDIYGLPGEGLRLSSEGMTGLLASLCARFPIISIEDGLHEDDWPAWPKLNAALPHVQIVGDDLFVTNAGRIARGVRTLAATAVLIKPNQAGTVTGTLDAMDAAHEGGLASIVSARSGETEDAFIADFAVGTGAGQIKIGSMRSSERLSKYNQLARLDELGVLPWTRWPERV